MTLTKFEHPSDGACTVHVGPHSLLVFHQQLTGLSERISVLREVYTNRCGLTCYKHDHDCLSHVMDTVTCPACSLLSAHIDSWRAELLSDPKLKALASTTTAHAPKHRLSRSRSFIVADTEASGALISQPGRVSTLRQVPMHASSASSASACHVLVSVVAH